MTTPTQDINENAPRVTDKSELVEWFESGCKPMEDWRIGTEHEKFGFIDENLSPLPYDGRASIRAIFDGLVEQFNWVPIQENDLTIGLTKDGASISLEPGGQLELSGAPLENIHQTCDEIGTHLEDVRNIARPLGIRFLGLGASPVWSLNDTPIMPKGRYRIMMDYMDRVGRLGRQMMFRTCTVQSNFDYFSEADMVLKFRVALALQPLGTALFANSPFIDARPNGFLSYRSHVWTDTDPDRTGMLPFVFDDGFGFESYTDYAMDVPMYFVRRSGSYLNAAGLSFRDFLNGNLNILEGERPAIEDWSDHLSTIFPEVRLKKFLEMRGSDTGPKKRLCAFSAFWTGILYSQSSLNAAWDLVKSWTSADREMMRLGSALLGLQTKVPDGRTFQEFATEVLTISRDGLKRREKKSSSGEDETGYLSALDEIIESGKTPAENLLEKYRKDWDGDVSRVFEELAY